MAHLCFLFYRVVITGISQLKLEISGLEELSRQLFLEVHENRNMFERIEWSKTWKGIYFNFLGYIFSVYCTWKILIVRSMFLTIFKIFEILEKGYNFDIFLIKSNLALKLRAQIKNVVSKFTRLARAISVLI